ncbi:MAG: hypothetical protein DRN26_04340 [Thermoplasmata archaeon]|nr:MAG: hypothetical protein DRN26_04340 [Thermoplasmata archaeon]
MGEIAFVKWLESIFGIKAEPDYRKGPLTEFLPSDIKSVNGKPPKLNISIKTTKLRGIWLDIPYKQIEHSDVFILVRTGVTRWHFLAFLKKISAIRDKILNKATKLGVITDNELKDIWDSIPDFTNVPAYIVGFFDKRVYGADIKKQDSIFLVDGEMKIKRFVVNKFVGYWNPRQDKYKNKVIALLREQGKRIPDKAEIKFEGIDRFSPSLHFLVSSGVLKRRKPEWETIINQILS